jgi:hypothetical protein
MNVKAQRLFLILTMLALLAAWAALAVAQPSPTQVLPATTVTPVYGDEEAEPLLMLTIYDPWRMVIGSDSPTFVVYATGQVIMTRVNANDEVEYLSVVLDEDELADLLAQLDIEAFADLDEYYDIALMTDQPTQSFVVATEDGLKRVTVYGSLMDSEVRDAAPEAVVDAYDFIASYENADAEPWLPTHFEVIVWPWDTSDAVDWPEDFPQLDSPFAVERSEVTSLYVEMDEYERFIELVRGESALRLDGDTYAFSVRMPFPHEVVWPFSPDATQESNG